MADEAYGSGQVISLDPVEIGFIIAGFLILLFACVKLAEFLR